jgi:hypothetical protein
LQSQQALNDLMNETNKATPVEFEEISLDPEANLLTDETITQDQINEMKMLGMPKPESVSWERWQRIQSVRSEHELMIMMKATGSSNGKIAKELGYSDSQVSKILNTPEVKSKVSAQIHDIYGDDVKQAMKARAMKSVEVFDEVLENGKTSEKLQAAQYILDHTVGKAQQNVQVKGAILADFIVQVEQMSRDQLRDVSSNPELLTKKPHKFDNVIEQFAPSDFVVGKRSDSEKQGE